MTATNRRLQAALPRAHNNPAIIPLLSDHTSKRSAHPSGTLMSISSIVAIIPGRYAARIPDVHQGMDRIAGRIPKLPGALSNIASAIRRVSRVADEIVKGALTWRTGVSP
ncbi:MAG: hypothetical protein EOO11_04925 [Chitinophagaceae bacterium]|nr:MAG: hypothetical protein EOO11_04925 [Chitinophagaceae bacterium]